VINLIDSSKISRNFELCKYFSNKSALFMISVIFHAASPQNIPLSFRFENAETPVFIDLFRFAALTSTFLKKIKLVCRFSENVNIVL